MEELVAPEHQAISEAAERDFEAERKANQARLVADAEVRQQAADEVARAAAERARHPRLRLQAILTSLQRPHIPSDQVHTLTVAVRDLTMLLLETAPELPAENGDGKIDKKD